MQAAFGHRHPERRRRRKGELTAGGDHASVPLSARCGSSSHGRSRRKYARAQRPARGRKPHCAHADPCHRGLRPLCPAACMVSDGATTCSHGDSTRNTRLMHRRAVPQDAQPALGRQPSLWRRSARCRLHDQRARCRVSGMRRLACVPPVRDQQVPATNAGKCPISHCHLASGVGSTSTCCATSWLA